MNIADNILSAVDLIANKKVEDAKYDKTIIAIVDTCLDRETGKYQVKYQGSEIIAYAQNVALEYKKGSNVYILVPSNDFSERKIILSGDEITDRITKDGLNDELYIYDKILYFRNGVLLKIEDTPAPALEWQVIEDD